MDIFSINYRSMQVRRKLLKELERVSKELEAAEKQYMDLESEKSMIEEILAAYGD